MGDRMPNLIEGKRCVVAILEAPRMHKFLGVFETFDKFQEFKKASPEQYREYIQDYICTVNQAFSARNQFDH